VVTVTEIPNQIPTANAGEDRAVTVNTPVSIHGTASDPDGTVADVSWTEGATVLSDQLDFSYIPTSEGEYILTLTVMDDDGATRTVLIRNILSNFYIF
jgi:hypothetical protein